MQQMDATTSALFADRFAKVRERFVSNLGDKADELDLMMQGLGIPETNAQACAEIKAAVHKLSGTGSSLGYAEMGEVASLIEDYFEDVLCEGARFEIQLVHDLMDALFHEMTLIQDAG